MGIGLDPWLKKHHAVMNDAATYWAVDPRGFEKGNAHGRYSWSSPGRPLSLPQLTHHTPSPPTAIRKCPFGRRSDVASILKIDGQGSC